MNTNPIDPLGHLTLAVKDIKKSKEFYQKIFAQLKIKKQVEKETGTAWEFLPGFSLWIKQAQHKDMNYKFHAPGFHHLCIKAKSKKEVDDFYNFLLSQKMEIYDPPKLYPKYTPGYYALFFADPDGMKLELAYY